MMMKSAALVLGLFVGLTQAVTFSNCCQGTLCSQKDNCPSCPENRDAGSGDCCGTGALPKAGETGCVHLEPSFEVDAGIISNRSYLTVAWTDFLAPAEIPSGLAALEVSFVAPKYDAPPESFPPLYLRNLSLLI